MLADVRKILLTAAGVDDDVQVVVLHLQVRRCCRCVSKGKPEQRACLRVTLQECSGSALW